MGNPLSVFGDKPTLKVEVFKWSSEEFTEEYALIYTSISDDKSICVVRASANPQMAQLTIHDRLCVDEGVSMAVKIVVERDIYTGEVYLGHHKVECSEGIKQPTSHPMDPFEYGSSYVKYPYRRAVIYVTRVESFKGLNFSQELLRMHHCLFFDFHHSVLTVDFKCHKKNGLEVEIDGPVFSCGVLRIHRTVKGNPEDYAKNYSFVKSKFWFPSRRVAASSEVSATGAVNNVNSNTQDAAEIWNKLASRFSQPDGVRVCHLQQLLSTTSQGSRTIDDYFSELNSVWEELRQFRPAPHCRCGRCNDTCFAWYSDIQQQDYVFKFLNGLNESFHPLRSQILLMKPLPSLDHVYSLLLKEESQRNLFSQGPESSAMAVNKQNLQCSHCGKTGHVKEKCHRLIGFPPTSNRTAESLASANQVEVEEDGICGQSGTEDLGDSLSTLSLSEHQFQTLISLLSDQLKDSPTLPYPHQVP